MLVRVPHVLGQAQLETVTALLEKAPFTNGRASAGMAARRVKNNEELEADSKVVSQLNEIVMGNLVRHPVYRNAALPHRIATPFYSRYRPGMSYGDHVDDPVMGAGERYRSDVSITVFLSHPESYEGGELAIQTSFGEREVKLPAGDAVLYPSSSRHRVAEVRRGERLAAVTWVQSLIRDPAKRELLYELNLARERLLRKFPDSAETKQVDGVYVNLIRMWSEV